MLSPSQSFRIPLARREQSFSISKAPASPPLPPLRKGGKGIARWRRHSIARNKNTRLDTVPPARSRPTLQHARPGLIEHPVEPLAQLGTRELAPACPGSDSPKTVSLGSPRSRNSHRSWGYLMRRYDSRKSMYYSA